MSERRAKVVAAVNDLESSAARPRPSVDSPMPSHEAQRRLQAATDQSERKIAHAKELTEELRVLRGRILAQLLGIRGQLDSVPAMLASVNRESELLDAPPAPVIVEAEEDLEIEDKKADSDPVDSEPSIDEDDVLEDSDETNTAEIDTRAVEQRAQSRN